MYKEIELRVAPKDAANSEILCRLAAQAVGVELVRVKHVDIKRRAVDARKRDVVFNMLLGVHIDKIEATEPQFIPQYKDVSAATPVVIIGAGPAGLFAALRLIERGFKPIILERGKSVDDRKKDLASLYKTGIVNPDSNFGYGEGGAGTFSDGKLYTRSKKRGNVRRMLEILVYHGAPENILMDAHPHIGTDKLPRVIVNMRKRIVEFGGEVHFNTRVTDLIITNNSIHGVIANGKEYLAENVIIATGHSARDIYHILHKNNVYMERKEFAVGLRLEHPQHTIDCIQYHNTSGRGEYLPTAEYSFVTNINNRGVYSFCMCPGGIVVPAATGPEQQVVNGMSSSGRNTPFANSAMVTSVGEAELAKLGFDGLFAGIEFQQQLEKEAWIQGGRNLHAPAQRMLDFMRSRNSSSLPKTSYKPGITDSEISAWFPSVLYDRMVEAFHVFGSRAKGFVTQDALLLGVETRTSSPLRVPRCKERFMHTQVNGLFPCGEGAGYAGGIISAAMDGENCANGVL
ncbi:MAG: NAD(P)/FAD-dependent oxidoreductase [Marinifilaceae bacterium]